MASFHFENQHPEFHAREGLKFRRRPWGSVTVRLGDQRVELTDSEWASVVAFLSKDGENAATFKQALAFFHGDQSKEGRKGRCNCEAAIGRDRLISNRCTDGATIDCPNCGKTWVHVCDEAEGCAWLPAQSKEGQDHE